MPTMVAPPNMIGATYHVDECDQRRASSVTIVAAAKAAVAWPDGNDELPPLVNPPPSAKSSGSFTPAWLGRCRPVSPLITYVTPALRITASVPCSPMSATL